MFRWLKQKPPRSTSEKVCVLLDQGIKQLNPEQWYSDIDAAVAHLPILVTLNRMLGNEEAKRFYPLSYDDLIASVSQLEKRGKLLPILELNINSASITALLLAGMHENELRKSQQAADEHCAEIRHKAQTMLSWLNRHSTTKSQPG